MCNLSGGCSLHQVGDQVASGSSIGDAAMAIGVSEAMPHRWRRQHGTIRQDAVWPRKQVASKDGQLKELVGCSEWLMSSPMRHSELLLRSAVAQVEREPDRTESLREFVERWKRLGSILAEIEAQELRANDPSVAARIVDGESRALVRLDPPDASSGLVEMQRHFARWRSAREPKERR